MKPLPLFPFSDPLSVATNLNASVERVLAEIEPLLTDARRNKIAQVVAQRKKNVAVVMEDIYDRGNVSAVMRSAEAFGVFQFHIIELRDKIKSANRVSQGAEKWTEIWKWKSTEEAVKHLRQQGRRVFATSLGEKSKNFDDIDWSAGPVALVLGNEKDGISPEMKRLCDAEVVLPMRGFVQSFNISVAGALALQRIALALPGGDLSLDEQRILRAVYTLRTLDSAEAILRK